MTMTDREQEINTIMTMVRTILIEAHLAITTKENVQLLLEDRVTEKLYAFKTEDIGERK